jgi:hypothetical protein
MKVIGILLAAAVLVSIGCAHNQPTNNVLNAPFTYPPGKSLTQNEVQRAIITAGNGLGWSMQPTGPGKIGGRLTLRTHVAEVDIEHNTKTYSIKYRDSQNLDAKDGTIHKRYNTWIANLDKAIQTNVNNAAALK